MIATSRSWPVAAYVTKVAIVAHTGTKYINATKQDLAILADKKIKF